MLNISGNALDEGGVAAIARALCASTGLRTIKLASHPLPVQQLKMGGTVEMDGQKLTDFDVQFVVEVRALSLPPLMVTCLLHPPCNLPSLLRVPLRVRGVPQR